MRKLFRVLAVMTAVAATADAQPAQEYYEINSTLMETTFRIVGPSRARPGEMTGGTVFILGKPTSDGKAAFVMITAAHVFEDIDGDTGTITFRSKVEEGKFFETPYSINLRHLGVPLYVKHPDVDVAALYVTMPTEFSSTLLLPIGLLASDEWLKKFEIHPGDELLCLGYPLFASADHGFPILRSGKIASYPLVPAKQHKNWLFDFRVFGGNSGGPVYFVDRNRLYGGTTHLGETIQFVVGLVTSQLNAALVSNRELQIGVVIPAVFIRETLDILPAESPHK
jgi:hypothetical protein